MSLTCVALGLDHRHIYGMTENMAKAGVRCVGYWTLGEPATLPGFVKRFPEIPRLNQLEDALNCGADLALISAIPADRADLTVQAMQHGMDVMSDKPGCTSFEQLDHIRQAVSDTGRIWSVNFSERFETPVSTLASELVELWGDRQGCPNHRPWPAQAEPADPARMVLSTGSLWRHSD
ncbi:Gfo/Idh/MocA family oxidoreductase [Ruegeria meonggei]|uniref:Gfo/Idh/MocA family oxidoreductase n=1 Tax=Ruegeria meonggei TaxID=1446476 RepID=UPI00366E3AB0